jgi:hypothetical protein
LRPAYRVAGSADPPCPTHLHSTALCSRASKFPKSTPCQHQNFLVCHPAEEPSRSCRT